MSGAVPFRFIELLRLPFMKGIELMALFSLTKPDVEPFVSFNPFLLAIKAEK